MCSNVEQHEFSCPETYIVWQLQILLVDDCKQWRQVLRSILEPIPYCQVVGEAGDTLVAVEKASQLRPDIVLLDIGMPVLNGIEAVPRIRLASPSSKVVFVTQENNRDVRAAALATGAKGYLLKSNVASELIPAIDALLMQEVPQAVEAALQNRHAARGTHLQLSREDHASF